MRSIFVSCGAILGFVFLLFIPVKAEAYFVNSPTFQGNNQHNGDFSTDFIGTNLAGTEPIQTTLYNFVSPVYLNGVIYYGEETSIPNRVWNAFAVEKKSGKELWRKSGDGLLNSGLAASESSIIIPGRKLFCLDHLGIERWSVEAETNKEFQFPIIEGNYVVVWQKSPGSNDGEINVFNIASGQLVWKKMLMGYGLSYPGIYNGTLIVGHNGLNKHTYIYSFQLESGVENWSELISSRNSNTPIVIDDIHGIGLFFDTASILKIVDLKSGEKIKEMAFLNNTTIPVIKDGFAFFLSTSLEKTSLGGNTFLNKLNLTDLSNSQLLISAQKYVSFKNNPIFVGDRIYFVAEGRDLYSIDASGLNWQSIPISNSSNLRYLSYVDGSFTILSDDRKYLYGVSDVGTNYQLTDEFTLVGPYDNNDESYNQYLGETHSHFRPDLASDEIKAKAKPETTAEYYKKKGYDFLAITEHDELSPIPDKEGITILDGAEEDTQGYFGTHVIGVGIKGMADEEKSDQERIDTFANQGGLTILPHPDGYFYNWDLSKLLSLDNYDALEIYNSAMEHGGSALEWLEFQRQNLKTGGLSTFHSSAYSLSKWDKLLTYGKKIWGVAGDDFTPLNPGGDAGAVKVFSKANVQAELISSLKNGNFYPVQGSKAPRLEISTSGKSITITSDVVSNISFYGKNGVKLKSDFFSKESSYIALGDEEYIRVEVGNSINFKKSWTEPIFVKREAKSTYTAQGHTNIGLRQANLEIDTNSEVGCEYTNQSAHSSLPPAGFLSPVYNISNMGNAKSSTLTIDYKPEDLPYSQNHLSIFRLNNLGEWEAISSLVDNSTHKTSAFIIDGQYVLSSFIPIDHDAPTIFVNNSDRLVSIKEKTTVSVNTNDDQRVSSIEVYLDTKLIYENHYQVGLDEFEINTDNYLSGNHNIVIYASDNSGNTSSLTLPLNIEVTSASLGVNIISPDNFSDEYNLEGNVDSIFGIDYIDVYLDGDFLGEAEVDEEGNFEYVFSNLGSENHQIEIRANDIYGNSSVVKIHLSYCEEVENKPPVTGEKTGENNDEDVKLEHEYKNISDNVNHIEEDKTKNQIDYKEVEQVNHSAESLVSTSAIHLVGTDDFKVDNNFQAIVKAEISNNPIRKPNDTAQSDKKADFIFPSAKKEEGIVSGVSNNKEKSRMSILLLSLLVLAYLAIYFWRKSIKNSRQVK